MGHPFKIHTILNRAELIELEEFAAKPGRSVIECREWAMARGHKISRSAIGRWLQNFRPTPRPPSLAASEMAISSGSNAIIMRVGKITIDIPPGTSQKDVSNAVQAAFAASIESV
jgi:hypothetical protein